MTIRDIITNSTREKVIFIVREALFCKVYEESAWRFVLLLRPYKPGKKFLKNINQEVVSIGFPKTQLDGIKAEALVKGFRLEKEEAGFLIFSAANEPDRSFTEWKNEIELIKTFRIYTTSRIKNNFYTCTEKWKSLLSEGLDKNEALIKRKILAEINSYLGILGHYKTYHLRSKIS